MMLAVLPMLVSLAHANQSSEAFYQLDYRERIRAELKLPALGGVKVKKSFETRYRPKKSLTPNQPLPPQVSAGPLSQNPSQRQD